MCPRFTPTLLTIPLVPETDTPPAPSDSLGIDTLLVLVSRLGLIGRGTSKDLDWTTIVRNDGDFRMARRAEYIDILAPAG